MHGDGSERSKIKERNKMKRKAVEKKISCTICAKMFQSNAHLEIHLRSHTGEKPFVCDECGKRFRYKNMYQLHLASHEPGYVRPAKAKPVKKCEICGKDVFNLASHMNTHSSEDIQCQLCDFKTLYAQNMKAHVKRVHDKLPLKETCAICGKETTDITGHLKRFHD